MRVSGALIAGGLFAAGCASAPPPERQAEAVDPVPGTVFVFDDGRVERFLRADGDQHVWATRRGREYVRAANPALPILQWQVGERAGKREVFGNPDALWPPQPGARASFRVLTEVQEGRDARRSVQAWTCAVGDRQTVETAAAGPFSAMPIMCERFSVNSMRLLEQRTWWWSEELGHYVRRRYQTFRDGSVRDISLCAALPETRANDVRIEAVLETCR